VEQLGQGELRGRGRYLVPEEEWERMSPRERKSFLKNHKKSK
jgi:hypothetical protein